MLYEKTLVRLIEDCKPNVRSMIFLEEECETISVNVVAVKKGESIASSYQSDEKEVYIIVKGRGIVMLTDVEHYVTAGMSFIFLETQFLQKSWFHLPLADHKYQQTGSRYKRDAND